MEDFTSFAYVRQTVDSASSTINLNIKFLSSYLSGFADSVNSKFNQVSQILSNDSSISQITPTYSLSPIKVKLVGDIIGNGTINENNIININTKTNNIDVSNNSNCVIFAPDFSRKIKLFSSDEDYQIINGTTTPKIENDSTVKSSYRIFN